MPFLIINITKELAENYYVKNSHWHEDLEVAYTLACTSRHYIDGVCIPAYPGRLGITNSESIHSILVDAHASEADQIEAVVLLIQKRFPDENFPEYKNLCFTNEKEQARLEIREIMGKLLPEEPGTHTGGEASPVRRALCIPVLRRHGACIGPCVPLQYQVVVRRALQ